MCHRVHSLNEHTTEAQEATNGNCSSRGWDQESNIFSAMVVDKWDSLIEAAVAVETVNRFKGYQGKLGY